MQLLPHRHGTDGFFIARLTEEGLVGEPEVNLRPRVPRPARAVAAPDEPARALPLRLLPAPLRAALGLPELRHPRDDRAHDRHANVTCSNCGGSMLLPDLTKNGPLREPLFESKRSNGYWFRSRPSGRIPPAPGSGLDVCPRPAGSRPGCRSARRCPTAGRSASCRRARCCSRRRARARRQPDAGRVVAPAVRDGHDAGIDRVGDLDGRLDRAGARASARARSAVDQPEPRGVGRVARAACSGPCPSRAARGCASRSCSSAAGGGRSARGAPLRRRSSEARSRSTSATIGSGASSIFPDGVRSTSGRRGSSGPRSMPCGFASSVVERQPVRPGAQHEVEHALGPAARRARPDLAGSRPASGDCGSATARRSACRSRSRRSRRGRRPAPWPVTIAGEPQQRLPLGSRSRLGLHRPAASSSRRCARRAGRARGRSARFASGDGAGRITSAWRVVSFR